MQTAHHWRMINNRKGVALILTFIFMISLAIIIISYLDMVTYGMRNVSTQVNNVKRIYLAEAGLNKAVWYLQNTAPDGSTNGSWRTTAYPASPGALPTDPQQESLGNGTYTMWVETSGSNILVTARGTAAGINRTIRETITLGTITPEAFNYALYADGEIFSYLATGTVTGNVAATETAYESAMFTGTVTNNSSVIAPTVSIASYAAIATTTVTGNKTFTAGTYTGIWYVSGDVVVNDNVTFNGTIVAGGYITLTLTDNFLSTPTSNYPALVSGASVVGNKMGTASTINGLVYAATNIDMQYGANNTVNGSLISGGLIHLDRGTGWSITYNSGLASNPPPYFTEVGGSTGNSWIEL